VGYGGGTRSLVQIAQLAEVGWGMMLGPTTPKTDVLRYAVDNGAYPCFVKGRPWDEGRFLKLLNRIERFQRKPDFACCPDIVAGGLKSLDFSLTWLDRLPSSYPWYLAVQDGMTEADVRPVIDRFGGLFVGGTTDWKMSSCPTWVQLARETGKKVHVGRVDTRGRAFTVINLYGVDSFDGNNWNRKWSRLQEKGKTLYFGRGRSGRRGIRDTAKPLDIVNNPQLPLDFGGSKP
jgi:hypothetical protein